MAGVYITAAECPAIRKRIDNDLDETMLSDETILLDTYAGEAEDYVVARLKSESDPVKIKRICILQCAGELVPAVRSAVRRASGDISSEVERRDWEKLQNALYAAADRGIIELNEAVEPAKGTGASDFDIFSVADGGRGK